MAGHYVFHLLWLLIVVCSAEGRCNFPPSLWCSSEEIAASCQVVQQCRAYRTRITDSTVPPVDFTLYYETLCPDCQNFYQKQLYPTYKAVGAIMNITLVPFGNAHEKKSSAGKWQFQCQHGEQECIGNIIDACTINIVKNFTVYFPFIYCMEEKLYKEDIKPRQAAEKCAKQFQLKEIDSILSCSESDTGIEYEHQMALKTNALQPPHTFVPWVELNGVHTDKIQAAAEKDLTGLICETYMGTKPAACEKVLRYIHRV
ncbi:gamma-interferon-inducible lysosomal thiol reductase-like [Ylistrum balloti]|uniref:gamma-interferon-inducible lysosomal thiol reductase-like n=1 Tax=Ylistrum balloti TaxID=509963 RepID=UPI0029058FA5|nr:gamma-interferon-inducible lysosomal thiol reductase-like [Ylistrum balloti]